MRASEEVRNFMLKYRPSGEMDERGITTHVARLARIFQDSQAWPGLTLRYDAKLPGEGGEKVHGADYLVALSGGGLLATFRLQAKRLYPAQTGPGRYAKLEHSTGSGDELEWQVDKLLGKTPRNENAGYIFYNGLERSVADVRSGCCQRVPERMYGLGGLGLTLAAAHAIKARWGQTAFDEIFPVSVPVACLARCHIQMARVDLRYPFFTARREPWEFPLYAAAMWSDVSRRGWDESGAQIIQTVNDIDPVAEYRLEQLRPGVEVTGGEMPRYLVQLREAGVVDLVDDDRPADVIMLLEAGPAPQELQ